MYSKFCLNILQFRLLHFWSKNKTYLSPMASYTIVTSYLKSSDLHHDLSEWNFPVYKRNFMEEPISEKGIKITNGASSNYSQA